MPADEPRERIAGIGLGPGQGLDVVGLRISLNFADGISVAVNAA